MWSLPTTRHRRTCLTMTPAGQAVTRFTYPGGIKGWAYLGVTYLFAVFIFVDTFCVQNQTSLVVGGATTLNAPRHQYLHQQQQAHMHPHQLVQFVTKIDDDDLTIPTHDLHLPPPPPYPGPPSGGTSYQAYGGVLGEHGGAGFLQASVLSSAQRWWRHRGRFQLPVRRRFSVPVDNVITILFQFWCIVGFQLLSAIMTSSQWISIFCSSSSPDSGPINDVIAVDFRFRFVVDFRFRSPLMTSFIVIF